MKIILVFKGMDRSLKPQYNIETSHLYSLQGYVTEIMLTLESAVDNINVGFRAIDLVQELFLSTPNLAKEAKIEPRRSATVAMRQTAPYRYRSTSYSLSGRSLQSRRAITSSPPCVETRSRCEYRRNRISED